MNSPSTTEHRAWPVFLIFLRLGLTSFGGPIAHLGYFREEFVARRHWLGDRAYADLVALCQFLPGPASSQVGMALGLYRAGYGGALAAWAGFTLPSALALTLFALGLAQFGAALPAGVLDGLKLAAVAVVAQAVWGMGRSLCAGAVRAGLMTAAAVWVLALPTAWSQVGVILAAGGAGLLLFTPSPDDAHERLPIRMSPRAGAVWLLLFAGLLLGLPLLRHALPGPSLALADGFFRAGSLVFGGGHVVLPLLQAEVVPSGGVGQDVFLAGYGAAQAIPGPLFTFTAFLGASLPGGAGGWSGALLALIAVFLPSFLLVGGVLPFWERLRRSPRIRAAFCGVNAAVVGLLLAALYDPVWISAVHRPADFALALAAFVALQFWKWPPWLVVLGSGVLAGLEAVLSR